MAATPFTWIKALSEESLSICVDLNVYPLEVLFRVCYGFTGKCYLFLSPAKWHSAVNVDFARKTSDCDLSLIAAEFSNELINQKVRLDIAVETRPIRELIVAQAFAEADFIDHSVSEADYREDPRGIAK